MLITLKNLPKVSLNKWYASEHWTKRKLLKDTYKLIIKSQFKHVFSKDKKYKCTYSFCFKLRPLDADNCIAMIKMITDIIFEDDKWDIITEITIMSKKGKTDKVEITVTEI